MSGPLKPTGSHFDYPMSSIGVSAGGTPILLAASLSRIPQAVQTARKCLAIVDNDVSSLGALFGFKVPPSTFCIVPLSSNYNGTGGAYHASCQSTTLYCDCDISNPERTAALFIAELSEVAQAKQQKGNDCGATNGEGLSRVHAELSHPGALDDFSTAASWLDGGRPNWVDRNENTDQDPVSNGCSVLFLNWLHYKGYSYAQITQAGGNSLAECYRNLSGKTTAWLDFINDAQALWPDGSPSGVTIDNPWPTIPLPPPTPPVPPIPPPVPPPAQATLTLPGALGAGTYILVKT